VAGPGPVRERRSGVRFAHGNLLLSLADSDVEADYPVLITHRHDRDIAGQVVLDLDNLLRSLGDVSGVGKGQVVLYLLLYGHRRTRLRGRRFSGQALGINLDAADAEQLLYPVTYGGIERCTEDRTGGLRVERRLER